MSESGAEAIGIGNHESILEASAEHGASTLERETIFEAQGGHLRDELAGDEFDDAERFGRHFAGMREDAGNEDRSGGAESTEDLASSVSHHGAVLGDLDFGVRNNGR